MNIVKKIFLVFAVLTFSCQVIADDSAKRARKIRSLKNQRKAIASQKDFNRFRDAAQSSRERENIDSSNGQESWQ